MPATFVKAYLRGLSSCLRRANGIVAIVSNAMMPAHHTIYSGWLLSPKKSSTGTRNAINTMLKIKVVMSRDEKVVWNNFLESVPDDEKRK